jgi:hypothetical protein
MVRGLHSQGIGDEHHGAVRVRAARLEDFVDARAHPLEIVDEVDADVRVLACRGKQQIPNYPPGLVITVQSPYYQRVVIATVV